jgi:hypothetical protein
MTQILSIQKRYIKMFKQKQQKDAGYWIEVFGLGRRLPEIDTNKMLRIPGHIFFHEEMFF